MSVFLSINREFSSFGLKCLPTCIHVWLNNANNLKLA